MHRMVECLGIDVLEFLPPIIDKMVIDCGLKDLLEFIKLLNQLISKFKVKFKILKLFYKINLGINV